MSADEPGATTSRRARRLTWGSVAWLLVLTAIGIVQVVRGQWTDAAIFGCAALVLAADAMGLLPAGTPRRRPRTAALLAAGVILAGVLGFAPRHGLVAGVALVAVAVAALVVAWPPPPGRMPGEPWPRALRVLAISWAVIWIVGCLWELSQFILGGVASGGRAAHPALSDLLDPLGTPGLGQLAFAVVWAAGGVFLVARGGRG